MFPTYYETRGFISSIQAQSSDLVCIKKNNNISLIFIYLLLHEIALLCQLMLEKKR